MKDSEKYKNVHSISTGYKLCYKKGLNEFALQSILKYLVDNVQNLHKAICEVTILLLLSEFWGEKFVGTLNRKKF